MKQHKIWLNFIGFPWHAPWTKIYNYYKFIWRTLLVMAGLNGGMHSGSELGIINGPWKCSKQVHGLFTALYVMTHENIRWKSFYLGRGWGGGGMHPGWTFIIIINLFKGHSLSGMFKQGMHPSFELFSWLFPSSCPIA